MSTAVVRMLCAYMGVQARTGVRSNVRNTIIVSGQEEPLPEFYFLAESSGAYLCLCLHTHECALSLFFLGVVLDHLLALACINVAFHPYIRAPMRVHHAPFPSSFSVLTPTHFGMHVP